MASDRGTPTSTQETTMGGYVGLRNGSGSITNGTQEQVKWTCANTQTDELVLEIETRCASDDTGFVLKEIAVWMADEKNIIWTGSDSLGKCSVFTYNVLHSRQTVNAISIVGEETGATYNSRFDMRADGHEVELAAHSHPIS